MASAVRNVVRRLGKATKRPDELSPADFETAAGSPGQETTVATITADTALGLRNGPIKLAIPAYESFDTAGDGSTQTFALTHSIVETEDTQDAVVWFGGTYDGVPTIDYDADEITVDGPGAVETLHVFYISDKPATVTLKKETANENSRIDLYEGNVGLVHQSNQSEQPERIALPNGPRRWVATDMELQVTVEAPYVTRFVDPDGDGAEATNALLQIGVRRTDRPIEGLRQVVESQM